MYSYFCQIKNVFNFICALIDVLTFASSGDAHHFNCSQVIFRLLYSVFFCFFLFFFATITPLNGWNVCEEKLDCSTYKSTYIPSHIMWHHKNISCYSKCWCVLKSVGLSLPQKIHLGFLTKTDTSSSLFFFRLSKHINSI